jgi:hypothetical protein
MRARTVRVSDPKLIAGPASEAIISWLYILRIPPEGEDVAECDLPQNSFAMLIHRFPLGGGTDQISTTTGKPQAVAVTLGNAN